VLNIRVVTRGGKQKKARKTEAVRCALVCGVALVCLAACGGRTEDSPASKTLSSGGTSSIAGAPSPGSSMLTGGGPGGSTATGGNVSSGGSVSDRACTTDQDCQKCAYITAPMNVDECADAAVCCGGPVMNSWTCVANYNAWLKICANQTASPSRCPCISTCATEIITCSNGECTDSCDS
jgi:hypothetical protein